MKKTNMNLAHLIQIAVADHYELTLPRLLGKCVAREYSNPRQMAMVLCHDYGYSHPEIGRAFKRDYTTSIHASAKMRQWVKTNPAWGKDYTMLRERIDIRWGVSPRLVVVDIAEEYYHEPDPVQPPVWDFTTENVETGRA